MLSKMCSMMMMMMMIEKQKRDLCHSHNNKATSQHVIIGVVVLLLLLSFTRLFPPHPSKSPTLTHAKDIIFLGRKHMPCDLLFPRTHDACLIKVGGDGKKPPQQSTHRHKSHCDARKGGSGRHQVRTRREEAFCTHKDNRVDKANKKGCVVACSEST